jgi:hypothetical protein
VSAELRALAEKVGVGAFCHLDRVDDKGTRHSSCIPAPTILALLDERDAAIRELQDALKRETKYRLEANAAIRRAGDIDEDRLAEALHRARVCLNWEPGYSYFDSAGNIRDDHGPAEHTEAARIVKEYCAAPRKQRKGGVRSR